jgi:enoyl-[acyl-carrier protein] reductase II
MAQADLSTAASEIELVNVVLGEHQRLAVDDLASVANSVPACLAGLSNAHPQYKDRVVAAGVGDTARHLIFGPEFPDASTRGLRNRIVQEWERRDHPAPYKVVPDSELPVMVRPVYGQEFPMKRFCGFPPTPEFTGDLEEMSLLAGESVGQTNRLMSAASIIDEMINGAEAVIRNRLGSMVVD